MRALRAALRMRERLADVNAGIAARHAVELQLRIGVNTGDVVAVTAPGPGEPMVAGDVVNTAARLEQGAEPGQILVSERTARSARGLRFEEVGARELRGRAQEIRAFALTGVAAGAPERGIPGLRAPVVGRDQELALLRSLYTRVAVERRPHLVTVYGDPGVGKSRLVAEFLERALDEEPAPVVLRGRCLPYGEGLTYWPLAEILKSYAGVRDSETPASALEKVRAAGRELIGPELAADPGRAIAALAFTVGLDDPEHSMRHVEPRQVRVEVHAAWRAFFSALGAAGPTVVVIEDIHWADRAMLDLLQELADRTLGGVLILCPSRPELTARRPDWGGGRRSFSSVVLEPLSEADADRLVDLLLAVDDLPVPVQRRIVERAEGNPFFLEEILRKLIDEGRIVRESERWRASGDIEDVEIPDTVQAVLAARIDLLEPEEKRTLQAAAVVGRVFWPSPVARLIDGDGDGLEEVLARLEDRELVLGRLGSSLEGEREFIFKHVLTCDVAYESLPRRERARAHAEVAGWLESTAGERRHEFAELLAYHYLAAHREATAGGLATDDDLRGSAFEYALLAAADARGKLALDSAGRLVAQALEIAASPLERSRAHEELGRISTYRYEGDHAWVHLRKAADIRIAETSDDRMAIARLCALALDLPTRWPGRCATRCPSPRRASTSTRASPTSSRVTASSASSCSSPPRCGRTRSPATEGSTSPARRTPSAPRRTRSRSRRACTARSSCRPRWTRSRRCGSRTATGRTSRGSASGASRWSTTSTTRGSWATSTPWRPGAPSTAGATARRTSSPTRAGAASRASTRRSTCTPRRGRSWRASGWGSGTGRCSSSRCCASCSATAATSRPTSRAGRSGGWPCSTSCAASPRRRTG